VGELEQEGSMVDVLEQQECEQEQEQEQGWKRLVGVREAILQGL
jgi:hypothetical protein